MYQEKFCLTRHICFFRWDTLVHFGRGMMLSILQKNSTWNQHPPKCLDDLLGESGFSLSARLLEFYPTNNVRFEKCSWNTHLRFQIGSGYVPWKLVLVTFWYIRFPRHSHTIPVSLSCFVSSTFPNRSHNLAGYIYGSVDVILMFPNLVNYILVQLWGVDCLISPAKEFIRLSLLIRLVGLHKICKRWFAHLDVCVSSFWISLSSLDNGLQHRSWS